jgi:hypothetical protein
MTRGRRLVSAIAVTAVAAGGVAMPPSTATVIPAGTVYVSTVPATPGLALNIGGNVQTTGPDGSVAVYVSDLAGIASRVTLAQSVVGGSTVALTRVVTGRHVPHESHLSVGLSVTSSVRLNLVRGRSGIDPRTVHRLRLHSLAGAVLDVDLRKTPVVRLLARRALLRHGVLTEQRVTWSVDRVAVAPGVAVTTAHAAFDPLGVSSWRLTLQTVHGVVAVTTVPPVAGVTFALEGATLTTDRRGRAQGPIADLNDVADRLRLASATATSGVEVTNMRVTKLPPRAVGQRRVLVAFDVRRPVSLRFVDLARHEVPRARISDVALSVGDSTVRLVSQELGTPTALLTEQATKVGQQWQARTITYTLRSVRIDGGQAVFNGRQRFRPSASGTWTIRLAVFTLAVTAHDAFFGSQLSSHLVITRPDGSRVPMQLSSAKPRRTPSMVRGLYTVQVDSAVLAGHASVLVSRNENIDLRVVTLWDAAAFLVLVLIIIVGAVLGGRRMAQRRVLARSRR